MRCCSSGACCVLFALFLSSPAHSQTSPPHLSKWLLDHPSADDYPIGVSWRVPQEQAAQQALKRELLDALALRPDSRALARWIESLPVTGRATVVFPDARWLMAHPNRDPVL